MNQNYGYFVLDIMRKVLIVGTLLGFSVGSWCKSQEQPPKLNVSIRFVSLDDSTWDRISQEKPWNAVSGGQRPAVASYGNVDRAWLQVFKESGKTVAAPVIRTNIEDTYCLCQQVGNTYGPDTTVKVELKRNSDKMRVTCIEGLSGAHQAASPKWTVGQVAQIGSEALTVFVIKGDRGGRYIVVVDSKKS